MTSNNELIEKSNSSKTLPPPHTVRSMTVDDVDECLRLFAINGLAETTGGLRTFVELEPNGYQVAVHSGTGEKYE